MKILFIGTVEFSYKALKKLVELNSDIVGVCTKDKSNFNSDFADLTPICNKNKIPLKYIDDINSIENINWIKSLNPDVIFLFRLVKFDKKRIIKFNQTRNCGLSSSIITRKQRKTSYNLGSNFGT